ncbi:MAG: cell envelope integrity protein CreD [Verrucomicrobiota bacterium]|jgi:inner membrane protein|nr:cell envelope integrity protein CreD [Verrucomicrobiota bacterium]
MQGEKPVRERPPLFSTSTAKILLLMTLVLVMLIPLSMVRGIVRDRGHTATRAEDEIMEAWGGSLVFSGPILSIPCTRTKEVVTTASNGIKTTETTKSAYYLAVAPKELSIDTALKTQIRKRGIFSVPLYSGNIVLTGTFNLARATGALNAAAGESLNPHAPAVLYISIQSQKGITAIEGTIGAFSGAGGAQGLFFEPGSTSLVPSSNSSSGVSARLTLGQADFSGDIPFVVTIGIQGGKSARFLPIAQSTHVAMRADWPSPSFQGAFLPVSSKISDTDFSAEWEVSYLSRDIPLFWTSAAVPDASESFFGVNFFRAIDTYALNTRAVKYAILFLIVPFLTLFLLEVFTKRRIHPVPYILVGIGNIIFYLLLLALSEQIPFYTAYFVAASAVTVMLTLYSRSLLPSWSKTWYMGAVAVLSYVLLYAVLNVESYALLIGALCTFAVTAFIMFVTRKFDWYGHENAE